MINGRYLLLLGSVLLILPAACDRMPRSAVDVDPEAPSAVRWQHTFGGEQDDQALHVIRTSDGGLAVSGWTASEAAGGKDALLLRTDSLGNLLWKKTYGAAATEGFFAIAEASVGGYILAGYTNSKSRNSALHDGWIVRVDSAGNKLWDRIVGGDSLDLANDIINLSSGRYVFAGGTRSRGAGGMDMWIVGMDEQGSVVWERTMGGEGFDRANRLVELADGTIAIIGQTNSKGAGGVDFYVVWMDRDGDILRDSTYGTSRTDWGEALFPTRDGGLILAGEIQSDTSLWDVYALRLDSKGNVLWQRTFGGKEDDWANAVTQAADGGFLLAGVTASKGAGDYDAWVLHLDAEGNLLWDVPIGGKRYDNAHSVAALDDGSYVLSGRTNSRGAGGEDGWLVNLKR